MVIILIVATGFAFTAGCASTSTTPATPPITPASATTSPVQDAGIRVITEELPPFNYAGPDGNPSGQSTDVVNAVLSRLSQRAEIELLPWSEGYAAARQGPMVALYSTGRTEEREHLFKWAGPITAYDFTFYTRNGSGIAITSIDDARTAGTIGVVKDDARHQFLLQENITGITTCDTDAECLRDLFAGKTDLWFGSAVNYPATVESANINPAAIAEVYQVKSVPMYIAFSNDTPDNVVASWQEAIDAMKQDGTFAAIRQKYNLSATV
jgi:ABC-type amino acid transport substrate-binding protein